MRDDCDTSVTLDDMAGIAGHGFVYVLMHGTNTRYSVAGNGLLDWLFGRRSFVTTSFIVTGERQNRATDARHADDLRMCRVGYSNGCYMVAPGFVNASYRTGSLAGSILFVGSCELMGKGGEVCEDWTGALAGHAAADAFVGFHNTNMGEYDVALARTFLERLLYGDTARAALDAGLGEHGINDAAYRHGGHLDDPPGFPLLRGNPDATLGGLAAPVGGRPYSWADDTGFSTLSREEQLERLTVVSWSKDDFNEFFDVSIADDGSVYAVGDNGVGGIVIKYDKDLAMCEEFVYSYGAFAGFYAVEVASDGSLYVAGTRYEPDKGPVALVMKLDPELNILCTAVNDEDTCCSFRDISCSPDGYVYAAGFSENEGSIVMCYDENLVAQHRAKRMGGPTTWIYTIDATSSGLVYVAGMYDTAPGEGVRAFIVLFDSFLVEQFRVLMDAYHGGAFTDIAVASDGSVYAVGEVNTSDPHYAFGIVCKFSESLMTLESYDRRGDTESGFYSLALAQDGSVYAAGYIGVRAYGTGDRASAAIVKLDRNLDEQNTVVWVGALACWFNVIDVGTSGICYSAGRSLNTYTTDSGFSGAAHYEAIIVR